MKFARPREAESFPDPRVHESILLRQASVRSKMRRVAAAKPHAQHVSLSGEHRMLKSSSARLPDEGAAPGRSDPFGHRTGQLIDPLNSTPSCTVCTQSFISTTG